MIPWFKKQKKQKLPVRVKGNVCLNCDAILEGEENFCPECGQRNNTNPLNFNIVLDEFFGNLFAYDSRLWNTIVPLVIKPGKTAYQFIYGKRKSLVNPFRIYLAISLVFFLVYGLLTTFISLPEDQDFKFASTNNVNYRNMYEGERLVQHNDSIAQVLKKITGFTAKMGVMSTFHAHNAPHSTSHALKTMKLEPSFWNRFMYNRVQSFGKILDDESGFNKKIFSGLSATIFLILPIFALILKLVYIRRKYSYMEHMVFVFYTQSVFFLLLLLFTIAYYIFPNPVIYLIFLLLFMIYLFLAMRSFYRQGKFKTFLKFILANLSFMILSLVGLILLTLISAITY